MFDNCLNFYLNEQFIQPLGSTKLTRVGTQLLDLIAWNGLGANLICIIIILIEFCPSWLAGRSS